MKEKIARFIIASIFIQCTLGFNTGFSFSIKEPKLSPEYSIIKETFQNLKATANTPLIINIQDAHCNYEAQKNLIKILEGLVQENKLKLILVEGGSGNVGLSFLRGFADKDKRKDVAEKYLKMGELSGEEYLDIVSDYDLELFGIDDDNLYDAHLASFWRVEAIKSAGMPYVQELQKITQNLKQYMFSDELKLLEDKKSKFDDKTISLADYSLFLFESAGKKSLGMQDYGSFTAFCKTAQLEKTTDFKQAEDQRNLFIKELAQSLDENSINELLARTNEFKENKITPRKYYTYLKEKAQEKGINLAQSYAHLDNYISYLEVSDSIDVQKLMKETTLIERKLKEASFVSAEQRRLDEVSTGLRIITGFLNLELTPEDYAYYQEHKTDFSTASWKDFLTENAGKYNVPADISSTNSIDDNFAQLEEFYQLGIAREDMFIANLARKMEDSGEQVAVLITGGFHTQGVTRQLQEKGYSYIVVAPVITQKTDSNLYFSVLRNQNEDFEDWDETEEE